MTLTMDISKPVHRSCDRCGRADEAGGIQLEDNTGTTCVFCRKCTRKLVEAVLTPTQFIAVAS